MYAKNLISGPSLVNTPSNLLEGQVRLGQSPP